MTKTNRITTSKNFIAIATIALVATIGVMPNISADAPPFKTGKDTATGTDLTGKWFTTAPNVCYKNAELNTLSVNRANVLSSGMDDPYSVIEKQLDIAVDTTSGAIDGLTITKQGTTCSVFPRIEIGAYDLTNNALAQEVITVQYANGNYKKSEIDFNTTKHFAIEIDNCGPLKDKDIRWIAAHELGHSLSLAHHPNANHSGDSNHTIMKNGCTSKWSELQISDITALETRY